MKTKCFLHLMRSALNWSFSFVKYEKKIMVIALTNKCIQQHTLVSDFPTSMLWLWWKWRSKKKSKQEIMSNHWNCRESTHADILLMIFIVSKEGEKFWRKNWSFAQLPRQHLSCLHMMKVRRLDGKWFMNVDIRCVWERAPM